MPGFGIDSTADKVGTGLVIATAAGLAAHRVIRAAKKPHEEEK